MFGWIENAVNQAGGWFGLDMRSPGERNAEKLARDNYDMQKDYFEHQKHWDQKNYEAQQAQFAQNFGFQQEKFAYDKALQQTIFNREDNSVQRRTADLKAAGINPILAAGQSAGAGSVVATTAPQGQAAQMQTNAKTPDPSGVIDMEMKKLGVAQMVMNALKMRADIDHTRADADRIRQQTQHDKVRLGHEEEYLGLDFDRYNIELRRAGIDDRRLDNDTKRLILESDRNELEKTKVTLQEKRDQIDRTLKLAQTNQINTQTAVRQLEAEGLPIKFAREMLDLQITARDFEYSVNAHIRMKDSIDWKERTAHIITGTDRVSHAIRDQYFKYIGEQTDKIRGRR